MADSNVNIRINATNTASPAINQVKRDLGGLDKAAGTATGGISALAKVAGAAGLVALGVQAAGATVELAKLGSASIAMKASFEQMAGGAENAASILDALTTASRGTISQYDLMLTANRSMLLGVADSAEEFSQLMQIATVRGRAMGLSTTQAFNDIVTGLGRESKLILDNLGIIIDLEKAHQDYAASIGKTAAQLTDAERKQALINQVIASSADLLKDANSNANALAGEGYAQLNTAWTNFKTTLGESLAPFLEARAKEIADFVNKASDSLNNITDAEEFRKQFENLSPSTYLALAGVTDSGQQSRIARRGANADLDAMMDGLRIQIDHYNAAVEEFRSAALEGDSFRTTAAVLTLQTLGTSIDGLAQRYNELAGIFDKPLINMQELVNGNIVFDGIARSLGELSDATRPTAEQIAATNAALRDMASAGSEFTQSFDDALAVLEGAEGKLKGLYDTLLDTGNIEGASKAFGNIRGVLQEIVAEWIRQGISIEEINNSLLPKLISELDGVIAAQVEAGAAGVDAGALIGSGFLSAIPGIQAVIGIVNQLTGATIAAGESIRAVQRQAGASLSQFAPGRGTVGAGGALAGVAPSLGRSQVDRSFGGLAGEFSRRNAGIGVEPFGIVGGRGASFGAGGGGGGSIDNEAQKLANRLTSILNGALKSGINLDEILGRQDAIEEPARRLADIAVRGFESPWVDYIRNTFPEIWGEIEKAGDPKAAAASILRDFEDGLRPELLDKGRAKELVKRALLGEQNTAALAAEIAGELASELGVSLQQAQQAAAGVLGTGTTSDGTDTGADGATVAAAFTDSFVGTMGTMLARFEGVGGQAGASFQVGFLATTAQMPAAILANLASLLLPMLTAALAGQGSRTGAS